MAQPECTQRLPLHTRSGHEARLLQAKQAVGSGFPALINSLKSERGDLEMMRGILESLALATQPDERSARMQVELPKQSQSLPCFETYLSGSCSSPLEAGFHVQTLHCIASKVSSL